MEFHSPMYKKKKVHIKTGEIQIRSVVNGIVPRSNSWFRKYTHYQRCYLGKMGEGYTQTTLFLKLLSLIYKLKFFKIVNE